MFHKNKIFLFTYLYLIFKVQNNCQIGCLKCTSLNQCLYCDSIKGYVLKEHSCIK